MPSVIAVNIWKGIPFYTMLLLAGLKAIDREQYEAAEVDGADAVARFRHITLPGLKYVIIVTVLLSTISTFNTFGLVYLMTGGGPGGATRLYSILAYEKAIVGLRFGPGAATAFSMAPVLALFILVLARFMRHDPASRTDETRVDRAFGWVGSGLGVVLDLIFWPFEQLSRGIVGLFGADQRRASRPADLRLRARSRCSSARSASSWAWSAARAADAAAAVLRAVPVLLDYHHVVQDRSADPAVSVDLLAEPWTLEQFQTLLTKTPYLTLVPQYGDCGGIQHGGLGCARGAGRLRAGAAQVRWAPMR